MKHICPNCGKSDLYIETGGIMGDVYHCKNCDYRGSFVIEGEEDMVEQIKESRSTEFGKM